jgi:hypothetical protein
MEISQLRKIISHQFGLRIQRENLQFMTVGHRKLYGSTSWIRKPKSFGKIRCSTLRGPKITAFGLIWMSLLFSIIQVWPYLLIVYTTLRGGKQYSTVTCTICMLLYSTRLSTEAYWWETVSKDPLYWRERFTSAHRNMGHTGQVTIKKALKSLKRLCKCYYQPVCQVYHSAGQMYHPSQERIQITPSSTHTSLECLCPSSELIPTWTTSWGSHGYCLIVLKKRFMKH